jgi:hypothetical protein
MLRYLLPTLFLSLLLVSCVHSESAITNNQPNIITTGIPKTDSHPPFVEETAVNPTSTAPFSNPVGDEITFLLRTRSQPIKLMIVAFSVDCLTRGASCDQSRASWILPANLYQIWKLSWAPDGKRAFFWDSDTGDVYMLNDNSGEITKIRSEVWKARSDFFVSPDGAKVIFEIDSGVFETDIVSMNIHTGEMTTFDIPIRCMKFVSGWLTNSEFLFWCEKYTGDKGYLENVEVYTFNLETHAVQPFEINRDWMQTSVPKIAPNGQVIAFTYDENVIIRDVATAQEYFFDLSPENYIWCLTSNLLAVYTQDREIFIINLDDKNTTKLYSFPDNTLLEDWLWLPENRGLLLVMANEDNENKTTVFLSINNYSTVVLDLPLFDAYEVVSISNKPMLDSPTP